MAEERLQKILAAAGVASRRASEALIRAGRVKVDGQVVTELGTKVDPDRVTITVDDRPIRPRRDHVYYKVYKPRGMLSDIGGDTRGRPTVADLLPQDVRRVFPVGRLDLNSEGLVLLTDDGALAHRLTHPRYEHPKVYYVLVTQRPPESALNRLRRGVEIPGGVTAPADVEVVDAPPPELILAPGERKGSWLKFVLREGKKRQIRHMIAAVELNLVRLIRWAIGPLTLAGLRPREARPLTRREIAGLRVQAYARPRASGPSGPSRSSRTRASRPRRRRR